LTLATPVSGLGAPFSSGRAQLWLKNDGVTHPVYGGNKIRKLEPILRALERAPPRRLLTFGAAGSHHVLTTALLGKTRGLPVAAVLVPQPYTPHVEQTLRAAIAQGLTVYPARGYAGVPFAFARAFRRGDFVLPPGASNLAGTLGYVEAALELVAQVRAGELPEPDAVVVAVGSGGTAAGLLAGFVEAGVKTRVIGVLAVKNPLARTGVLRLARAALQARSRGAASALLAARLELDASAVGSGYGAATPEAERAVELAERELGLSLEVTYTGKAFGRALALAEEPPAGLRTIVYWHTLSARPLAPLLDGAPELGALPREVARLLGVAARR
jgi:D-cysteine desulfhydrase